LSIKYFYDPVQNSYNYFVDLKNINIAEIKNLDNFTGIVPVFPLSTVVFFPNTLLPLHIFEQKYRNMLSDSLNSEKIIAMALLKPGWDDNYYGSPEVFDVAGMGRIVSSETFDDGRSNIVLYGLKRIKIVEFTKDTPYRKARIEILNNKKGNDESGLKEKLKNIVSDWNDMLGTKYKEHQLNINLNLPLGSLTDVMASVIFTNIFDKQSFLEETDVEKRAKMLIESIETRLQYANITSKRIDSIVNTRNLN
jgi:Lon protease-like protein